MIFAITEHKRYKRCDYVKAEGRIDNYYVKELKAKFNEILEEGRSGIVFDVSDVGVFVADGFFLLLKTHKACKRANGKLVLVNVPGGKKIAFERSGLYHFIEAYDDINEAVDSF